MLNDPKPLESPWRWQRDGTLVCLLYVLVLFATSFLRWLTLNFDEVSFYVPAIRYIASRLPRLTFDYPFAAPPVALHIQAILFRLAPENFAFIKLFSLACALLVGASVWYLISIEKPVGVAWRVFPLLTCFPFLLNSASQLKHHEFTVACLILGFTFWQRNLKQNDYRSFVAASLFFTAAAGSNQFAVVLPIALALHVLLSPSTQPKLWSVLPCVFPVLLLLACFAIWKGPQSPIFRTRLLESEVGGLTFRPAHLVGILLTLGAWLFPVLKVSSNDLRLAAWAFIPSLILVHFTGLYRPDADFYHMLAGPVSSLLRAMSLHSYSLCLCLVATVVACGVSRTISLARDSRLPSLFALYVALFFVTINFVPYYFESYYLYLILPAYLILLPSLIAANTDKFARIGQLSVGLFGIIYSVTKAIGNSL